MIRDDLQVMKNAQDVYAVILAAKVFRMLMTMIVFYDLKTRQLDAINAFLNVKNDEEMFCYMSNDYKNQQRCSKSSKHYTIKKIIFIVIKNSNCEMFQIETDLNL